jgi:outer membrane beta-barrel protein
MKRRFAQALWAAIAWASLLPLSRTAHAQEIQLTGPLKGAPAVRHLRLYRDGRFNIAPAASFSLLDEYRRTILFGARIEYNFTDWLAFGVWGGYGGVTLTTDLTDRINVVAPRDALTATNVAHTNNKLPFGAAPFENQVAKLQYVGALQATFTPFRGKLAIFNKIFVDTDLYLVAGGAIVGIQQREECGAKSSNGPCSNANTFQLASTQKIAPTFGLGLTFYPGNFWSLGVEYRALPFSWNRSGFDTRGTGPGGNFPDGNVDSQDETFKFNQFVTVAIGFYIPTKPPESD